MSGRQLFHGDCPRRCLGEDELQTKMGLSADAFYNVISQVGKYDDVYTRHLNPIGLSREGSANAGWLDGGLIYAPPTRSGRSKG